MSNLLSANVLKEAHRRIRDQFNEPQTDQQKAWAIRLHRAISWLASAEHNRNPKHPNLDLEFISLWISFNACYGIDEDRSQGSGMLERQAFRQFIDLLVKHDQRQQIYHALWNTYSASVKSLLANQYVYAPFWQAQRSNDPSQWRVSFNKSTLAANRALGNQDVSTLLSIVLDRLYVLRNQLMHGGATWNGSINRSQVKDGANMLSTLLPIIIRIMLTRPNENWGEIHYPVIN